MQIIYHPENLIDAHLVKNALEGVGIRAFLSGEYLIGALGDLPAIGLLALMVAEDDVAEASRIAQEIDGELRLRRSLAPGDGGDDWLADPA